MNASRYGGYEAVPELPELYDQIPSYQARRDAEFYVDLCREARGEVLELGCGTGRVLISAAEAGCTMTGLDQSRFMLERCRRKVRSLAPEVKNRVTLVEADMTNFTLDRS
ncbi:MAG: type 12 methyltransferase [Bryobacterales bacterium]|nr:type 12 methyltransferase [Bryobacterales bacterium]